MRPVSALVTVVLLLVAGCSSSRPPTASSLLSEEQVTSRDGRLNGRLPRGWFSAAEDSLAAGAVVWLVRDDLAAGIAVTELQLDAAAGRLVRDRGVPALAAASRALRGLPPAADGEPCQELGGGSACGYRVLDAAGSLRSRVVVFARGTRFYECELVFLRTAPAQGAGLEEAFRIQEAFVEALTGAATSS